MNTTTLETQTPSAKAAISTPLVIDYDLAVAKVAERKVDNGAQFSSTKGKTNLLNAVIDYIRSITGQGKFDAEGKKTSLPSEQFESIKSAIERFWHLGAKQMVDNAIKNDARITMRRGVLMSRVDGKSKIIRSKTDRMTMVYVPTKSEHKFADTVGLTAAKQRLDVMLDNVGKWSREELEGQRNKIVILEKAIAGDPEGGAANSKA